MALPPLKRNQNWESAVALNIIFIKGPIVFYLSFSSETLPYCWASTDGTTPWKPSQYRVYVVALFV